MIFFPMLLRQIVLVTLPSILGHCHVYIRVLDYFKDTLTPGEEMILLVSLTIGSHDKRALFPSLVATVNAHSEAPHQRCDG